MVFSDLNGDGGIRVSVNPEVNELIQEHHYYPFGMEFEGPWTVHLQKELAYQYNGKELNEDLELGWLDYGARWYDPAVGRWNAVDALADDPNQVDKSPYAYAWNNPVNLTDPDGNCPSCLIGAIVGAGLDYSIQVAINRAEGQSWGDSFTKVDGKSIAISAIAGATGAGLLGKTSKLLDPKTRRAAEMAIDASVNVGTQIAQNGEVDLRETGLAVLTGQAVRTPSRDKIKEVAQETTEQLNQKVDDAGKALSAAQRKNRPGLDPAKAEARTAPQKQRLKNAQGARVSHIRATNANAAAVGASSSGVTQRLINSLLPNAGPTYNFSEHPYVKK
ncbi:MAG: hypothetical protein DHS20C18_27470 [Saprospiraceae bacterium]|nr:MAG: hypothetical protein DHS20C18_27470 [Saprospiraceae bacterium]